MPITPPHPFSVLTPERILATVDPLLACRNQISDGRILALNSYENRVYQIGIEDSEPVIAKFYRPGRWSEAQLCEEHAFTQELADDEQTVIASLVIAGDSLFHTTINGEPFYWALFPRRGGRAPELDNPDCAYRLGIALGRLHSIGAARLFSARDRWHPAERIQTAINAVTSLLPDYLHHNYQQISEQLLQQVTEQTRHWHTLTSLRVHADCHAGNILWRDDTPYLLDFDDSANSIAMQDIWMLLTGDRCEQLATLSEVIEGYETFRQFDPRELALVESLRTARIMHHAGWLASRWQDPAFPLHFPWFNTDAYWAEHLNTLREQSLALQQPPLTL